MANTIAKATGIDNSGRQKETRRLGSHMAMVEAATYRTFAYAAVDASGAGYVLVTRDGVTLHKFDIPAEERE